MTERDANAALALLKEAAEHGVGVAFIPDADGWEVVHVGLDWPAHSEREEYVGRLSYAYDLETACAAALRPLKELGVAYALLLESRHERS